MKSVAATLVVLALTVLALPSSAAEIRILHAATELANPGAVAPSRLLVRAVLEGLDADTVRGLDQCLSQNGLGSGDYGAILSAERIRNTSGRTLWFVRPALTPYCSALYGAHLFRYFLLEERGAGAHLAYRIVFQDGGDDFQVFSTVRHGLNDIEPAGCISGLCQSARLSFDGHRYRPIRCSRTTWNNAGREVTVRIPCAATR